MTGRRGSRVSSRLSPLMPPPCIPWDSGVCWGGSSCFAGVITYKYLSFFCMHPLRTGPGLYPPSSMSSTWITSNMWAPLLTSRVVGVHDCSTCRLVLPGWSSDHCCPMVSSDSDSGALWCGSWLVPHRKDRPCFPGNPTPTLFPLPPPLSLSCC